ncbi:MAG TPA: hypothetical protein VFW33_07275 [Gemmataceae bacterium]|nr:hypothetical protein [Gemmataceae bacterium]
MATLSLPLPRKFLIDEAIGLFRRERVSREPVRRKPVRSPEPQPVRVEGIRDEIVVKIASEADEWEQAFELVANNYQESGYEAETGKPYRFTPHHALPDTTVFVAKRGDRVIATFTLVADNSVLGLPLESLYADEVEALRREGRRVGEITSLAFTDLGQREFLQVFVTMIRLLQQYHVSQGGDTWVITVNPRHRSFYCKVLGARQLGGCKSYDAVAGAPAEAYWVDREMMKANAPRGYETIFGQPLPAEALAGPSLPRPFVRYFGSQSSRIDEGRLENLLREVASGSPRAW